MSINVNDKNLGHATAYAYYKAGGGTMTEAEFTEFMADFGTASQTAVEAAQAALASKNAAQTAATTATNKASEATTAATTATTKAGEASTSASTATSAKDTAVSASQTATTKATEATTAAATAVSAATTATTAKDDAVSAKTAAQTAQTGAETAAASVEASAAQIATNAEDITQLKSELSAGFDFAGIEIMPYVKTGTGYIADNCVVTYSSPGSGNNYMMLIDDVSIISNIKRIKAHLGNSSYKYGIAFVDANGTDLTPYGEFPNTTATAQTIEVDVPDKTAKIYIYNRYSVLERPTIAIETKHGYEERISTLETDYQNICSKSNMLMTAYVKKGYWYNAGSSATGNYDYYIVPVEDGISYTISKGVRFLSKQSSAISGYNPVTTIETVYTADFTGNLYITFANTIDGIYFCKTSEYQEGAGWFNKKRLSQSAGNSECAVMSQKAVTDLIASVGNDFLNGKKWVACGDSFTHGDFTGLSATDYQFQDEPYKDQNKVYPFFIGRRTGANIVNEAVNGSTMAYIDGSRSEFSTPNGRYTQIPSDADYITLYFGINDSHHSVPIGTISDNDNTTFYGAWNVVMQYLIANHPNAKIGIIISNGCDSVDYPNAEIAIAKKYGVSYLDFNSDYKVPILFRVNGKPDVDSSVISANLAHYRVSSTNGHPNVAMHEYESTIIQHWLESM